jgi:hypothetical protein
MTDPMSEPNDMDYQDQHRKKKMLIQLSFTEYELNIIREALISDYDMWQDKVDNGVEVSKVFMTNLRDLVDAFDEQLGYNRK